MLNLEVVQDQEESLNSSYYKLGSARSDAVDVLLLPNAAIFVRLILRKGGKVSCKRPRSASRRSQQPTINSGEATGYGIDCEQRCSFISNCLVTRSYEFKWL